MDYNDAKYDALELDAMIDLALSSANPEVSEALEAETDRE